MSNLNEDLITNKDVYETIREEINCKICLGILINPKQCSNCETSFCGICIKGWEEKKKTCPMRCNNYKIQEASRVIKNMLVKLTIKCDNCDETVNYELYVKSHSDKTCSKIEKIKCPMCGEIKSGFQQKDIDTYNQNLIASYESEIIKLRNEIKSYKEVINILSLEQGQNIGSKVTSSVSPLPSFSNGRGSEVMGIPIIKSQSNDSNNDGFSLHSNEKLLSFKNDNNGGINSLGKVVYLKWKENQKKSNHTFSNDMKVVNINYSSCWNFYFTDYIFNKSSEEVFGVKVKCKQGALTHHYIGFMNDSYGTECLCLYNKGAFFIHDNGENFKEGKKVLFSNQKMKMESNTEKTYLFKITGSSGLVSIYSETKELYGTTTLSGKNFQFFVAKCNSGNFEYTIIT